MRKGFVFDHNKCLNCNACSAACILENGWTVQPRKIYTYNSEAEFLFPVINLSLACNHCESAVCMSGCPTSAYSRDAVTGAIILDEMKCIGCKYCQWNCPYDAPKYDSLSGVISKCHLCYSGFTEGRNPACSSACPTGALRFELLKDENFDNHYSWFPDKKLDPAIEFTAKQKCAPLEIIPENIFGSGFQKTDGEAKNISAESSLILFSFLSALSVSSIVSSFIKGVFPEKNIFLPILLLAGVTSFFHLGKKFRSWRSLANLKNSPLSREIAAFIVYAFTSSLTVLFHLPGFLIASSITGLLFLILIDSVYIYSVRNRSVLLHSGQTFISALLIISFFYRQCASIYFYGFD